MRIRSSSVDTDGRGRFEFYWPDPDSGPYLVAVTMDTVQGRLEVVGVEMWGRTPSPSVWQQQGFPTAHPTPISSTAIRLPLDRIASASMDYAHMTAQVISYFRDHLPDDVKQAGEQIGRFEGPKQPGRPTLYDRAHFEAVAAVYNEALARHGNPTAAVASRFNVSKSTAAKWVARCRNDGLLPPTARGRAAGSRGATDQD